MSGVYIRGRGRAGVRVRDQVRVRARVCVDGLASQECYHAEHKQEHCTCEQDLVP